MQLMFGALCIQVIIELYLSEGTPKLKLLFQQEKQKYYMFPMQNIFYQQTG